MLRPDSTASYLVAQLCQPDILETMRVLDHILEIIDVGEIFLQFPIKLIDCRRQLGVPHQPEQISEVRRTMEHYPFYIFMVNEPRRLKVLCKVKEIYSLRLESLELHSRFLEEIGRLVDDLFFINVELKVELPGANGVGDIAVFIGNCEADLNEFGFLDISAD